MYVPGKIGNKLCSASEDVRLSIVDNDFAKIISDALNALDEEIEHELDNQIEELNSNDMEDEIKKGYEISTEETDFS